jgi:hypothetical protein
MAVVLFALTLVIGVVARGFVARADRNSAGAA